MLDPTKVYTKVHWGMLREPNSGFEVGIEGDAARRGHCETSESIRLNGRGDYTNKSFVGKVDRSNRHVSKPETEVTIEVTRGLEH